MTNIQKIASTLSAGTAALVTTPQNRRYLTDFPASDGCLFISPGYSCFLTDSRYIEAAQRKITDLDCFCYERLTDTLKELIEKHNISTVLIECNGVSITEKKRLSQILPVTVSEEDRLDKELTALRVIKRPDEIARIKEAQRLAEEGFQKILEFIQPGMTEKEVALELEYIIRRMDHVEDVSFDVIAVAGLNSSLPHGVPGSNVLKAGDFLTMDFGALVDGYHSDMTRTVAIGYATDEMKQVYETVLQAQLAFLAAVGPGVSCFAGDAAARDIIRDAGYGEYFGHGTGHGVGIEIHEEPRLSRLVNPDVVLEPGQVVTVEPGIYLPGKFGVRIEDMVVITETGCENLTRAPKQLIIL